MEKNNLQGVNCQHQECEEYAVAICEDHHRPICEDCLAKWHLTCNINLKKYHSRVLFYVTKTIKKNIKKINDFDLKMNKVFSQNIPDMKKYFESIKIRVNEINEDKNKNEDAVINRFKMTMGIMSELMSSPYQKCYKKFRKDEDPNEIEQKLRILINQGTIQTDYLKQLIDGQSKHSKDLEKIIKRIEKIDRDLERDRKERQKKEEEEQKRRKEAEQKGWLSKLFCWYYPDEVRWRTTCYRKTLSKRLIPKGKRRPENRKLRKGEYNEGYDFEQFSSSDSDQSSDLNQVQYKTPLGINEELKKIKEEVVTKKLENNKITKEEFKKKENQEEIKVCEVNKEESKERKAYKDEMEKVKSNDLNRIFRQLIYQFYY